MIDRRTFLLTAGALAAGAACGSGSGTSPAAKPATPPPPPPPPEPKKLSVLILGGTGFLGPHMVEAAKKRGHTLTLFNRGKTNPGLFPDVEKLQGDRDGNLEALKGRTWDAVIDPSGYVPRIVRASADLLAPSVGHYVFISTISVYDDSTKGTITESSPLNKLPPGEEKSEEVRKHYGALKAACEHEVATVYPDRHTTVRPGLIVGPGDPTDRFTYWPVRIDRGGDVLAPGDGTDVVQFIDGRDLATWIIKLVEDKIFGTYTANGPQMPIRELLETCQRSTSTPSTLVWAPWPFLEKQNVGPWSDMPVWIPKEHYQPMAIDAATSKGLAFRPTPDIVRDTLTWWKTLPAERQAKLRSGLSPDREKEVLAAFRASGAK